MLEEGSDLREFWAMSKHPGRSIKLEIARLDFRRNSLSIVALIWLTDRASNFDIAWWKYPPSLIELLASKKAVTISPLVTVAVKQQVHFGTGETVSFSVLVSLVADM
jgi:hypothetical protein